MNPSTSAAAAAPPSLHALQTQLPGRALSATLFTLLALVAVLLVWALVAQLDIVVAAQGRLVPVSQVKSVQAGEPGIVREILVADGHRVRAGQVLLRLDATVTGAEAQSAAQELARRLLTVRAIDAALAGRPLLMQPADPALLFAQINAQFAARRQALADAEAEAVQAAARAAGERAAAAQLRDKLAETVPIVRQTADSYGRLLAEGFVGELAVNEKRRELIEREQDYKAQQASVAALDAAIAQAQQKLVQLRSQFRSQLLSEKVQAQAEAERLQQERTKLGFRSQQLDVRAPADGIVQDLALSTPGAVVAAGQPLLAVVPAGETLQAEALLANEDIGFVEVGQRVKLKLAAYPFQKYGVLEGTVTQISADAMAQNEAARATGTNAFNAPALTYKAVVALDGQALPLPNGRVLPVASGMGVTAEIHQGRRTVMEYLLSPVQRVAMEAGRER
jgi:hemolysin D